MRLQDPPKSLTTQYQVQNETQIRKYQKLIKKDNDELIVKSPKNKQPIIQQRKIILPSHPSCRRNNWLDFDKVYFCKKCDSIINK